MIFDWNAGVLVGGPTVIIDWSTVDAVTNVPETGDPDIGVYAIDPGRGILAVISPRGVYAIDPGRGILPTP